MGGDGGTDGRTDADYWFGVVAAVSPRDVDFVGARMEVFKNDAPLSEGVGAAALGSPLTCVAWLANTLGEFGVRLLCGDIILSGSWVPLEPVQAGDAMRLRIEGVGEAHGIREPDCG